MAFGIGIQKTRQRRFTVQRLDPIDCISVLLKLCLYYVNVRLLESFIGGFIFSSELFSLSFVFLAMF